MRVEPQGVFAGLEPGETALQQVDGPGHRGEVDPLRGRTALDVGEIAAQRSLEVLERGLAVRPGEDPGMHQRTQRGPVRRAGEGVIDGHRDGSRRQRVPEPAEQLTQLVGRHQVEEHQHVGLLAYLHVVDGAAFRFQNPVEALQVAVAAPVVRPVELGQAVVVVELLDDAGGQERHVHATGQLRPVQQFRGGQPEPLDELDPSRGRQCVEDLADPAEEPDRHHVRVGVVVDSRFVGAGVPGRVLVRPDHPPDPVPVEPGVVAGEVREEPGDLQHRLRPVLGQELQVRGRLVVGPDVVGDGQTDVSLQVAVIG